MSLSDRLGLVKSLSMVDKHTNRRYCYVLVYVREFSVPYMDTCKYISRESCQVMGDSKKANSAFNVMIGGDLINRQVGVVSLYREQFSRTSCKRHLYVHNNPYAPNPIPKEIFSCVPQFIFRESEARSRLVQQAKESVAAGLYIRRARLKHRRWYLRRALFLYQNAYIA